MEDIFINIVIAVAGGLILFYIFGIGKSERFSSRYSSAQSIKILPPSLGGVNQLNLDNVATLQLYVPYDINKITLISNRVPVVELPPQAKESFKTEGFKIISHKDAKIYTFSTSNNVQKIKISKRTFVVNLCKISKMNIKDVPGAIQYEFGITEE